MKKMFRIWKSQDPVKKTSQILDVPVGTYRKLLGKLSFYQYNKYQVTKQYFLKCVLWSINQEMIHKKTQFF